jgi:GNAT superfamily N-acetyltransferase
MYDIVSLSERQDLALDVAGWIKQAFRYLDGVTTEELCTRLRARKRPEESFILLADNIPVGVASFRHGDLASRPDLTPWLSTVYVVPAYRRRGYASALVRHVEAFARTQDVATLWLYTLHSAGLYARLGWHRAGLARDPNYVVVLMRRDLTE